MKASGTSGCKYGAVVATLFWAQSASGAKVACVGDSITFGHGLANRNTESYPAVLADRLGAGHTVQNFGVSGTTLLKDGDVPYWDTPNYTASGAFDPDVVVIMLGTNDAKPQNWSREAEFSPDYAELIAHYRSLGALVYIATPPPVYGAGAFDIQPGVVTNEVVPLVRTIATNAGTPLVDVFTALSGKSQMFPDTVHPNAAGAELIADTVFAALEQHGLGGAGGMGGMGGMAGAGGMGGGATAGATGAGSGGVDGSSSGAAGTNAGGSGGAAMGGAPTAGGTAGESGASNVAGTSNGGGAATGGATASGGSGGGGGSGGTVNAAGGAPNVGSGGAANAGGNASPSGAGGQVSGSAGAPVSGGAGASASDDGGCGCRVGREPGSWSPLWVALGVAFARVARSRTRRRNTVLGSN